MPRKSSARGTRRLDPASTMRVPEGQIDPTKESKKMGRTADFSQIGYKTISGGQYEVEFMSYEWKDPKVPANGVVPANKIDPETGKQYQYANCKIQVTDTSDESGESVEGHILYDKFSKNPASLFAMKRMLIAFGMDPQVFEVQRDPATGAKLPLELDLDELLGETVGRRAIATVSVREYKNADGEDATSNEIAKYEAVEQATAISASRR